MFIDQTIQQIKATGVWQNQQYGFTKGRSTTDALVDLVSQLRKTKKAKRHSLIVSLDITGAFDNISHRKIIDLLFQYGVQGNLIQFAHSYLTNRTVKIKIANATASKQIDRGCAQGSKCGPGLFLIAMNELLSILQREGIQTFAYADDLLLVLEGQDAQSMSTKMNALLQLINLWGASSGLKFNPKKTQGMMVRARRQAAWPAVVMADKVIPESKTIKYLGVHLNNKITWHQHIQQVKLKAQSALNVCKKALGSTWGLPSNLRRRIYDSIILPICTYASPVWIEALSLKSVKQQFRTIEQSMACLIIRCQRTAKYETIVYLSSITPISTIAKERSYSFTHNNMTSDQRRRRKAEVKMDRRKWREGEVWQLIPSKHRRFLGEGVLPLTEAWRSYASTHFLLNTGFFVNRPRNECPDCKSACDPTQNHILFHCPVWEYEREKYLRKFKLTNETDLKQIFIEEKTAIAFNSFCKLILTAYKSRETSSNLRTQLLT